MTRLPEIAPGTPHAATLRGAGWSDLANGDWARALLSPDGTRVARIAAFDPGWRLFLQHLRAAPDPYFALVHASIDLAHGGLVALLDRLFAPEPSAALSFVHALGGGRDGEEPTELQRAAAARRRRRDSVLAHTAERLVALDEAGRATLPCWGGLDLRTANVMATADGRMQLIDPCYVDGRRLIEAIGRNPAEVTGTFSPESLRAFLEIPVFN